MKTVIQHRKFRGAIGENEKIRYNENVLLVCVQAFAILYFFMTYKEGLLHETERQVGYGLYGIGARLWRRADSRHIRALAVYRRTYILRVHSMEKSRNTGIGECRPVGGRHRTRIRVSIGRVRMAIDAVYHRCVKTMTGAGQWKLLCLFFCLSAGWKRCIREKHVDSR